MVSITPALTPGLPLKLVNPGQEKLPSTTIHPYVPPLPVIPPPPFPADISNTRHLIPWPRLSTKPAASHTGSHYPSSLLYPGSQPSTEASRASTTQDPLTSQQSTKAEDAKATRGIDGAGSPVSGFLGTRQWLGHSEGPAAGQSCAERPLEDRRAHRGRRSRGNQLRAGQSAGAWFISRWSHGGSQMPGGAGQRRLWVPRPQNLEGAILSS